MLKTSMMLSVLVQDIIQVTNGYLDSGWCTGHYRLLADKDTGLRTPPLGDDLRLSRGSLSPAVVEFFFRTICGGSGSVVIIAPSGTGSRQPSLLGHSGLIIFLVTYLTKYMVYCILYLKLSSCVSFLSCDIVSIFSIPFEITNQNPFRPTKSVLMYEDGQFV